MKIDGVHKTAKQDVNANMQRGHCLRPGLSRTKTRGAEKVRNNDLLKILETKRKSRLAETHVLQRGRALNYNAVFLVGSKMITRRNGDFVAVTEAAKPILRKFVPHRDISLGCGSAFAYRTARNACRWLLQNLE